MATVAGLLLLAAGGFTATAVVVSGRSPAPQLNQQSGGPPGTGPGATASGQLPNGAAVPAADLVSDPVFVTDNETVDRWVIGSVTYSQADSRDSCGEDGSRIPRK